MTVNMEVDQITIDLNPAYNKSNISEKNNFDLSKCITLELHQREFITQNTFHKLITDKFLNAIEAAEGAPPIPSIYLFAFVEDASQCCQLYDGRALTRKIIEHNKKKEVCINPSTEMPLTNVHYFRMKKLFAVVEYLATTTFDAN